MASSPVRVEGTDDKEDDLKALPVVRLFRVYGADSIGVVAVRDTRVVRRGGR